MRITLRRVVYSILIVIGIIFFLHLASQNNASGRECLNQRPNDHKILSKLAAQMHKALQILQTPHFLCHESLWGSLYNDGPRTWDTTIDFCFPFSSPGVSSTSSALNASSKKGRQRKAIVFFKNIQYTILLFVPAQ